MNTSQPAYINMSGSTIPVMGASEWEAQFKESQATIGNIQDGSQFLLVPGLTSVPRNAQKTQHIGPMPNTWKGNMGEDVHDHMSWNKQPNIPRPNGENIRGRPGWVGDMFNSPPDVIGLQQNDHHALLNGQNMGMMYSAFGSVVNRK